MALTAGVGVLYCGEREIEWERMAIMGGRQSRPRFICPAGCGAGAYKLYSHAESFACQRCSGYVRPSRAERAARDPRAALMRRMVKLRLELGVRDPTMLCDLPPPPRAPRAVWLYRRRALELRAVECQLLGIDITDLLRRDEPPEHRKGEAGAAAEASAAGEWASKA